MSTQQEAEAVKAWMESFEYKREIKNDGSVIYFHHSLYDVYEEQATFFYRTVKQAELEGRIDELVTTYNDNFIHWGDDLEKAKVSVTKRLAELHRLQKGDV